MSSLDELLSLAKARGIDTEKLLQDISNAALAMGCGGSEQVAYAILCAIRGQWRTPNAP